jgi:hypothetical protein
MATPRCQRCVARGLTCFYPGRAIQAERSNQVRHLLAPANDNSIQSSASSSAGSTHYDSSEELLFPSEQDNFLDESFLNSINESSELQLIDPAIVDEMVRQEIEEDHIIAGSCYQARTEFCARVYQNFPKQFVDLGSTPFIHNTWMRENYMPVLQDAMSCCALYCSKTPENETLVFRDVEMKAQKLVRDTNLFIIDVKDLLTAVQAMILYQVIRLFDGNIRQRAQAEEHEAILRMWTTQLKSHFRHSGSEMRTLNDPDGPDWTTWILSESIRRTVLSSYMLDGTYTFLKQGYDHVASKIRIMSFTAHTALWDANSEYSWRQAYHDTDRLEINIRNCTSSLMKARPNDLCDIGKMILAAHEGVEYFKEWLGKEKLV